MQNVYTYTFTFMWTHIKRETQRERETERERPIQDLSGYKENTQLSLADISPKAQNTQDTTHRPYEAQEEGIQMCGYIDAY